MCTDKTAFRDIKDCDPVNAGDPVVEPIDEPEEVVVVGMSRSLALMIVAASAFFGMCVIFTSLLLWNFDPTITSFTAGVLGFTAFGTIFMTMRYFTEQAIVYNAMNFHLKTKKQ
jgi:hypothetical protein